MDLVVIIGGKIRIFDSRHLPGNIIWPLTYTEAKVCCKTYIDKFKTLKQSILWMQKCTTGPELEHLQNYFIDCCIMESTLQNLKDKIDLTLDMQTIVSCINEFRKTDFLFDKLLWRRAQQIADNKQL